MFQCPLRRSVGIYTHFFKGITLYEVLQCLEDVRRHTGLSVAIITPINYTDSVTNKHWGDESTL